MSEALEFIYQLASKRVSQKIKETGIHYNQIYLNDPKVLSNIVCGNRTKTNRFLIPDRILIDREGQDGLIPNVFFPGEIFNLQNPDDKLKRCKCEILWGKETERLEYTEKLFEKIMKDVYGSKDHPEYELFLCAYVPFAQAYTYRELLNNNPGIPAIRYGILSAEPGNFFGSAVKFVYHEIRKEYEDAFLTYTNEKDTFKKIDKDFYSTFVNQRLKKVLKKYVNEQHPLGLRARELILGELSLVPTMLDGTMDKQQAEYYRKLNRVTTNYFLDLERIQFEKYQ